MAENRRGLGRGLSALLGEAEEIAHAVEPADGVRDIPIELIHRNADQPRQVFSEAELAELEASIRSKGILQPILVRPVQGTTDEYQIVAGERRWRAAQKARLHEVPVVVKSLTDTEALEFALIENIQRADLNAMEEARGYHLLVDEFKHSVDEVAKVVGKSRRDRKSTRLNSSHLRLSRMPSSA